MSVEFAQLQLEPAYRKVAAAIGERILSRTLREGARLPSETELARQFGVNRSTVREAIRELETQGLLGRDPGRKRLRVTRPEPDSLSLGMSRALALHDVTFSELWEAMMAIEPAAAEHAAERRSAAALHALVGTCARFRREHADTTAAVAAVVDFFTAVAAASANRVLALAQAPVNRLLAPTLAALIDRVPQARTRIEEAQSRITAAIRERRPEVARTWMEKHIRDFKRGYELSLRTRAGG